MLWCEILSTYAVLFNPKVRRKKTTVGSYIVPHTGMLDDTIQSKCSANQTGAEKRCRCSPLLVDLPGVAACRVAAFTDAIRCVCVVAAAALAFTSSLEQPGGILFHSLHFFPHPENLVLGYIAARRQTFAKFMRVVSIQNS